MEKIKFNKKMNLDELSKMISNTKEEILNDSKFLDLKINPNKRLSYKNFSKIVSMYGFKPYRESRVSFLLLLNILMLLVLSATTTYSVITYFNSLQKNNTDKKTGILNINMVSEVGSEINLYDTFPMSDEEAKNLKPFIFTISNTGTINGLYRISLVDYSDEYKNDYPSYDKLDYNYIKYSIECENDSKLNKSGFLSDLNASNNDINKIKYLKLIESNIKPQSINKKFYLRLWVDKDSNNDAANKYFVGKIMLESDKDSYEK